MPVDRFWWVDENCKWSEGGKALNFAVQRRIAEGGREIIFQHEDQDLCRQVAALINFWEMTKEVYGG